MIKYYSFCNEAGQLLYMLVWARYNLQAPLQIFFTEKDFLDSFKHFELTKKQKDELKADVEDFFKSDTDKRRINE